MSETTLIAICTCISALVGAAITALIDLHRDRTTKDTTESDLLLDAQKQLTHTVADAQRLWQWNRQLMDHIYKGLGPPPPKPPANLFTSE